MPYHQRADIDHRKRYFRVEAYSDAIWERCLRKYVPSINCRSKWSTPLERDLVARSAELKTATGNRVRPIVKLAPVFPSPDSFDPK